MSCKYKDQCPSYSGWCEGPKQDFSRCVEFLVTAYEHDKMLSDDKLEKAINVPSSLRNSRSSSAAEAPRKIFSPRPAMC